MVEKDELAKVIADLEARLKETEFMLEEYELRESRERKVNKEVEEELLMYKNRVVE